MAQINLTAYVVDDFMVQRFCKLMSYLSPVHKCIRNMMVSLRIASVIGTIDQHLKVDDRRPIVSDFQTKSNGSRRFGQRVFLRNDSKIISIKLLEIKS